MPTTEMLINYVPGEECRIAIVEDGKLEEFYQERASTESHVSNIYKGRVTNVEPAIQAAFVDFGLERNGFLHISDLHPKYFPGKDREEFEKVGHKTARHERPPIQKCLKRGQEVLVQVLKEGIGTKGPTLTSYLSIPGRFLVMMPDMQRLGVSRKVDDDDARKEMRDILKTLNPPKEFGFIVRTAGIGQTKTDLKRDLSYLQRLWKNIERKRKQRGKYGELYAESDLVIRTIRDVFSSDIDRIVCDDLTAARRARDFLAVANPRTKSKVVHYDDPVPLFHRMGIEEQLDNMNSREVPLPSGGALVIDPTEALVAIDVNSGKSRAAKDAETNAYKTNLEAVDEIARQLRLRDLGGLVVLDLIDMRPMKNRKAVESRFRNNLKKDRARTRIGPISQFGLLEMTRQRMRPSLVKSIYQECSHCNARGYSMSPESVILSVMRRLALVMHRDDVASIELTISPDVAFHILNRKRGELVQLEAKYGKTVMVRVGGNTVDFVKITAMNEKGVVLPTDPETYKQRLKPTTDTSFRELAEAEVVELEEFEELEEESAEESNAESGKASTETESDAAEEDGEKKSSGKSSRRRRRGRKKKSEQAEESTESEAQADTPVEAEADDSAGEAGDDSDGETTEKPKRRRRRRRGGRGRNKNKDAQPSAEDDAPTEDEAAETSESEAVADEAEQASESQDAEGSEEEAAPKKRRRRRSRGKKKSASTDAQANEGDEATSDEDQPDPPQPDTNENASEIMVDGEPTKKKRSRRTRSKKSSKAKEPALPLDEFGDVNGNVKVAEDGKPVAAASEGNAKSKGSMKSTKKKKPLKPGRGYANRIVSG
ncbi:ribonuclease E/G [Algisphaera agarilytica]|uniref:Ribonuclease G n=1 Tax=Algisphaera agarilytica TaxID=1385975 RepID=A0A7X0LJ45_9BACT|nr:Rne/Rng family ribonuclease [Algisphaera agarilytica]MBB6428221.1 ribonuclease E [Algisphaera agarilytica]